jgi:hypothetical protein
MTTTTDTVVQISVNVTVDVRGNPHVTCTPYDASVTCPTTLQFNLATPGWVFPSTNAAYLNNPPNANFPSPAVTVSSTQATWQDVFAGSGDIAYTVAVQRSTGGPIYTQDPVIHNNDSTC